ncbi:MAG: hypothetical protein ACP5NL_06325 [Thermoplasmata archaeon]
MSEISLKTKNKIIVNFVNGKSVNDISIELKIPIDEVNTVIEEWKGGYLNIELDKEIPGEIKELAELMRDKELSIQNLIEGYFYYSIFSGMDKEKILLLLKQVYDYDDGEREKLLNTAEKMIKFSKYENIDFVDIPDAIEKMVEKGKTLNSQLKKLEAQKLEREEVLKTINTSIEELSSKLQEMKNELSLAEYLKSKLSEYNIEESKIRDFLDAMLTVGLDTKNWEELAAEMKVIKSKNMSIDQFLKVSRYFEELMEHQFTLTMIKELDEKLKESNIGIEEYLNERYDYVRDKIRYIKSMIELKKEHKALENRIRDMNTEIRMLELRITKEKLKYARL